MHCGRWMADPASAPLYFSCMSALHHSASCSCNKSFIPALLNLKEEQGGCFQNSSLVLKIQDFLKR